ncbi:type II toxin-antitoxin system VapC family toxin [Corynebacterium stercoris]
MFLLDTNVVSELRKSQPDSALLAWLRSRSSTDLYLSVITVMELEIGAQRMARNDLDQARRIRSWIDNDVLKVFDGRILPVDLATAKLCAASHVPDPAPERDALIGATASVYGLTVATRNEKDFRRLGVPVFNPFGAAE